METQFLSSMIMLFHKKKYDRVATEIILQACSRLAINRVFDLNNRFI